MSAKRHEVEGVVVFQRDPPEHGPGSELCHAQCGPNGHIKGRSLRLNTNNFVRSAEDFIRERVLTDNRNEGRRVRVIVEVLDAEPATEKAA